MSIRSPWASAGRHFAPAVRRGRTERDRSECGVILEQHKREGWYLWKSPIGFGVLVHWFCALHFLTAARNKAVI